MADHGMGETKKEEEGLAKFLGPNGGGGKRVFTTKAGKKKRGDERIHRRGGRRFGQPQEKGQTQSYTLSFLGKKERKKGKDSISDEGKKKENHRLHLYEGT